MKIIQKLIGILIFSALGWSATIYEDGEDNNIDGWIVYDNNPSGATIENVYDGDKQSRVIELKGDGRDNSYALGGKRGSRVWNNTFGTTLSWSMKTDEKFKFFVYVDTLKGKRYFYYDYKDSSKGLYDEKYIRIGLGATSKSGTWKTFTRDLEADLKKYESDNTITAVNGIRFQGSTRIDDIVLSNDEVATLYTISERISSGKDDAEEFSDGEMYLNSSDLELIQDKSTQTIGLRFQNINIPKNSTITRAYLQFEADETDSETTNLVIHGEKTLNTLVYTKDNHNITNRTQTSALVTWSPAPWTKKHEQKTEQKSEDLSVIVQEIIGQEGWSEGNALAFIISGSGKRVAESYDGDKSSAPLLVVEYKESNGSVVTPDTIAPVITLNGESNITLTQGSVYIELNATAVDDVDGEVNVTVSGVVDTAKVGVYTLTYTATDSSNNSATETRTVNVVKKEVPDMTPPVITLNGESNVTVKKDGIYTELNATAVDDVDGNVSVTVRGTVNTATVEVYTITYTATDSSDNSATKVRTVNVVDNIVPDTMPPVITLNGDKTINLTKGDVYNELGATATDDVDGSVTVTTSGEVDSSAVGTYTITYTAKDSSNNESNLTREVNVVEPVVEYGVNVGEVRGNTALLYKQAYFEVSLKSKPESNVTIPLSSTNTNEGDIVGEKQIVFTPENWDVTQSVSITGKNKNLGDGEQNYKVTLGKIVSDDENYKDIDPDDVELKFRVFSISEPDDKYDFVPTSRKVICLKVNTAILKRLKYNLLDVPDGMINEKNNQYSPCLEWKAPISESGTTHAITIEVTDGAEIQEEISFDIHVANTVLLQSKIHGNSVTIIDPNTNLKGLTVTPKESGINLEDIKFRKVVNPYLLSDNGIRISDIFIAEKLILGELTITIPKLNRIDLTREHGIGLYGLMEHHGEIFYAPLDSSIVDLSKNLIIKLDTHGIGFGEAFLGLTKREGSPTQLKKNKQLKMFKINPSRVVCTPTQESDGSLNYELQYCNSLDNRDINITVKYFGTTATATHWSGVTIEEMVAWILDAQEGFINLSLAYKNKFMIKVENTFNTFAGGEALGFVSVRNNENYNTLHLYDGNRSKEEMKAVSVHEYYHHAQAKTIDRDKINGMYSSLGTYEGQWFSEGTARWFEDYLYDDLNSYFTENTLHQILEVGLSSRVEAGSSVGIGAKRPYQRFAFFKLLKEKCTNFDAVFSHFQVFEGDNIGVENLKSYLSVGGCNFGSHLNENGIDKRSTLASALSYYQYATVLEKDMKLLDSTETSNSSKFILKDDKVKKITSSNWREEEVDLLSTIGNSVSAYGAKSIKIEYEALRDISGDINLSIRTDRPITVIGVRLDQSGHSKADGINDNFHFRTQAGVLKEYTLTEEDRAGGLFITLLDESGSDAGGGVGGVSSVHYDSIVIDKLSLKQANYFDLYVHYRIHYSSYRQGWGGHIALYYDINKSFQQYIDESELNSIGNPTYANYQCHSNTSPTNFFENNLNSLISKGNKLINSELEQIESDINLRRYYYVTVGNTRSTTLCALQSLDKEYKDIIKAEYIQTEYKPFYVHKATQYSDFAQWAYGKFRVYYK